MAQRDKSIDLVPGPHPDYGALLSGISDLLGQAGRAAARAVNTILTATYWEVGRRLIEFEQGGQRRAAYGEGLLRQLGHDLTATHGRGFSERNLRLMRAFYLSWEIRQTPSAKFQARAKGSPFADAAVQALGVNANDSEERVDNRRIGSACQHHLSAWRDAAGIVETAQGGGKKPAAIRASRRATKAGSLMARTAMVARPLRVRPVRRGPSQRK